MTINECKNERTVRIFFSNEEKEKKKNINLSYNVNRSISTIDQSDTWIQFRVVIG